MMRRSRLCLLVLALLPGTLVAGVQEQELGHAVERHLSTDEPFNVWTHDPQVLDEQTGDRLETREVAALAPKTVKLKGLVPPLPFASGVAEIPESTVRELQSILDGMRDRHNVRLHLVGHADNQPLSPALASRYGDNAGLSRERAGEVAEFFQTALDLDAESITYEWAGDTQPIASNDTFEGRAQNRRVEVQVWYDELEEQLGQREVVVASDVKRVKVCRVDTVCKLRYVNGHDKRARVQNLIAPLQYDRASVDVTTAFVERIKRTLYNLRDKQNVTVKFVGHTDSVPLDARAERIYGSHSGLAKARAWRVALDVRDRLGLDTAAIDAAGFGMDRPIASNETPQGQALNRRIEVEFWYDDPLQELPDEPQLCPAAAGEELVTRVYEPAGGALPRIQIENGDPQMPAGLAGRAGEVLAEVADRRGARLRFVGYTRNATLDRRTAAVYGDDVGLATARARRAMEAVVAELGLAPHQAEFEGRGYVHSADVVNAGFVQGDTSHVDVQVVYDELAVRDDLEGLEISPLQRELKPENAFALNLMRITVDGVPVDDPGRSSADVQRCTDVALDEADIRFGFDNLVSSRRLSVDATPARVAVAKGTNTLLEPVTFRMHANYVYFIDRSEVRIFADGASTRSAPLATLPMARGGVARWIPLPGQLDLAPGKLQYVLRAYSADGNFDETAPRPLWLVRGAIDEAGDGGEPQAELLAGYGESALATQNIRLGSGTVSVRGSGIPEGHDVWVAGHRVPVDLNGNFVAEQILPEGAHTVEVAVLDDEGNGELFLRDLVFEPRDWFYVGMADLTLTHNSANGPVDLFQGDNAASPFDESAEGRLAFYANGKFGDKWRLTASMDTREAPLDELFSNVVDKAPDALFRRIDPDYHYPTFGDDSIVEEAAPTSGKLYLQVGRGESHALWGNFHVAYNDNELAQVDRGLYGANVRLVSSETTSFGERRFSIDGFGAEPGTVPTRQEFRGTGGSLYFLRHQDLLAGSERVRIEMRDSASGLVTGVVQLRPALDYDIDYLQGTVLLAEPLASTVSDDLLVRSGAVSGDEAYLVVRYEYTPGFDDVDAMAVGAQGHYWINDFIKVGLTGNLNELDGSDSDLQAVDVTLRKSADTWLKLQTASSSGLVAPTLWSADGGFGFSGYDQGAFTDTAASAFRADASVGFADVVDGWRGRLTIYSQSAEAGYSAPGLSSLTDVDHLGATLSLPLGDAWTINAKSDKRTLDLGVSTEAHELDVDYQVSDQWSVRTGVRQDVREDDSILLPLTQDVGERTDAIVQIGYDSETTWRAYAFVQDTVEKSEGREDNGRFGLGGVYQISDKLALEGELSTGDLGAGGRVGTSYTYSEQTSLYLNYALENERSDNDLRTRRGREGTLVTGVKSRLTDSASVFAEERYRHGRAMTGLTHATGVTLTPTQSWNLGVTTDMGTLRDLNTGAEVERKATGVNASYALGPVRFSTGVEYRKDVNEQPDLAFNTRKTWLFRSSFKAETSESSRWLGKLNHSESDSTLGEFYAGGYTEASLGYAFRPIAHDRLNTLVRYTYLYNVPSADQVTLKNTPAEYVQKSHVAAVDVTYDLTSRWSIGGKYAYRAGQISLDREDEEFFDNSAHLVVLRADYRLLEDWEILLEARHIDMTDLAETRSGGLVAVSRYVGEHLKVGVGYNFTDFSDDLTDLSFDHRGAFLNITGML